MKPNKQFDLVNSMIDFYILSFTWGIIQTLLGLILLLLCYVFLRKRILIRFIAGRINVTFLHARFGGLSIGIVYFTDNMELAHTHCHEIGHTVQSSRFGPLYLIIGVMSVCRYWYRRIIVKLKSDIVLPFYDGVWFESQATAMGLPYLNLVKRKLVILTGHM